MTEENGREHMTLCNYPTSECESSCCSWAKCSLCLAKAWKKMEMWDCQEQGTLYLIHLNYKEKNGDPVISCAPTMTWRPSVHAIPGDENLHDTTKSIENIPSLFLWDLYWSEMQDWAWWHASDRTHSGVPGAESTPHSGSAVEASHYSP